MLSVEPRAAARVLSSSQRAAEHVELLLAAVLAFDVRLLAVDQRDGAFEAGLRRRSIVLVGDDPLAGSLGPGAFHQPSLARAIRRATHGAVVACAPLAEIYITAAVTAAAGGRLVLVETVPEFEIPWIEFLRSHNPTMPLKIGTVAAGRA